MGLFKNISQWTKKITEKAKNYSTSELIADSIIKAEEKKEKVNVILQNKGSQHRIKKMILDIDFPPNVKFEVLPLSEDERLSIADTDNIKDSN